LVKPLRQMHGPKTNVHSNVHRAAPLLDVPQRGFKFVILVGRLAVDVRAKHGLQMHLRIGKPDASDALHRTPRGSVLAQLADGCATGSVYSRSMISQISE